MEPHEYLRVVRRRWRLLAACVLVAAGVAWITTPAKPANDAVTYRATHQLIRDSGAVAPPAIASLAVFVKTGEVPRRVAERLDYPGEPALLAAQITLDPDEVVGTLGITSSGATPKIAAERANAFAEETLAYLGEQSQDAQQRQLARLNDQLAVLQVEIDELDKQLPSGGSDGSGGVLRAERDSKLRQYGAALDQQQQLLNEPAPSAGYVTLQEALPELASAVDGGFSAPSSRVARTVIAVIVGLILGLAAVLMAERLDTRLNGRDATELGFGLPVLAEVPKVSMPANAVLSETDPISATAEAYRTLRAALVLMPTTTLGASAAPDQEPQVILVTSPAPGDGKTTTAVNLAACFAAAGRSVLVLGCDFRRPQAHNLLGADLRPGIADVLTKGLDLTTVIQSTPIPNLRIATSGSNLRSFGDVAHSGRALVEEARRLADVVVIDTAPVLATNDATELIPSADAVVIVARAGRTSADGARRTRTLLERLSAPTAGVVLVGVSASESPYASYYSPSLADSKKGRRGRRRSASGADPLVLTPAAEVEHSAAAAGEHSVDAPPTGGPVTAPASEPAGWTPEPTTPDEGWGAPHARGRDVTTADAVSTQSAASPVEHQPAPVAPEPTDPPRSDEQTGMVDAPRLGASHGTTEHGSDTSGG